MVPHSSTPTGDVLRRPNGRPQACDPCRSRKLACDHKQPVCSRCVKTRRTSYCTYTASRPRRAGKKSPASTLSDDIASAHSASSHSSLTALSPDLSVQYVNEAVLDPGYLGFTSHSTVFSETQDLLSIIQGFRTHAPPNGGISHTAKPCDSSNINKSPLREQWHVVLSCVRDHYLNNATKPSSSLCAHGGWYLAYERVSESLRSRFKCCLAASPSDAKLEEMAQILSRNSTMPIKDNHADTESWLAEFTGPNLRWESIGLIFAVSGHKGHNVNGTLRNDYKAIAALCMNLCIKLSRRFAGGNLLQLYLGAELAIIESQISGDASLSCWRYHASAVSLLTYLGLHVESENTESYQPTLCSEYRRRLFAYIYIIDKTITQVTGRPPAIAYKYVSTPLPLDVPCGALIAGGEALDRAVARLSPSGWDMYGGPYPATFCRARMILSTLREEIIESALSKQNFTSLDSLLDIKQRQIQSYREFPKSITYNHGDLESSQFGTEIMFSKSLARLDHLQNLFMLERLLQRHGSPNDGTLLELGFEIVSLTLVFWKQKDRFSEMVTDLGWLAIAYAAPGGGVLCMELLNPMFSRPYVAGAKISRGAIIQQLSLLVGLLDWIHPSAPNAHMCHGCKTVIERVLDHCLNTAVGVDWAPDKFDHPFDINFNFDLLDTFSWARS